MPALDYPLVGFVYCEVLAIKFKNIPNCLRMKSSYAFFFYITETSKCKGKNPTSQEILCAGYFLRLGTI